VVIGPPVKIEKYLSNPMQAVCPSLATFAIPCGTKAGIIVYFGVFRGTN